MTSTECPTVQVSIAIAEAEHAKEVLALGAKVCPFRHLLCVLMILCGNTESEEVEWEEVESEAHCDVLSCRMACFA